MINPSTAPFHPISQVADLISIRPIGALEGAANFKDGTVSALYSVFENPDSQLYTRKRFTFL
jgi:hypothetical protein